MIDGDTIAIGSQKIRFEGIDAPETDQLCLDATGNRWACGLAARDYLLRHIAGYVTSCVLHGTDRFGRALAVCTAHGENLNSWMVREGLALAYVKYSREFVGDEGTARDEHKGLWAGAFIAPWDWRHRKQDTVVLGAFAARPSARTELSVVASSAAAPSPECGIKGNVNSHGERIYHMPGQAAYSRINMQDSRKRWFCSEEDAQVAGWRPARN